MFNKRTLLAVLLVALALVVVAGTSLAKPGDPGGQLGCQRNNPDRLDCSSLEVTGYCDGTTAVFTIRNTGEAGDGDMRAPTQYRIIVDNVVVEPGWVQLAGGTTMTVTYEGGGTVTLEADQQVGHPGNSRPRVTLNCGGVQPTLPPPPTVEPTLPPTATPTPEPTLPPTDEPTPTPDAPALVAQAICYYSDSLTAFVVSNNGAAMTEPIAYAVYDQFGNPVDQNSLLLGAGESVTLTYPSSLGYLLLVIGDWLVYADVDCSFVPEPDLSAYGYCATGDLIVFDVTNYGGPMTEPLDYWVFTAAGLVIDQGTLQLGAGETTSLVYPGSYVVLTLLVGDWRAFASVECYPTPTPEPTVEPPPDATPTPTDVPTSTPIPTDDPLGCQGNNPDRLDCSSLQVTGYCDGTTATFLIHNGGEPGNGDMRAPTEYRIYVDGVVVFAGQVMLNGDETMVVTYPGSGTVKLEADQQVGHPGSSQPQTTLTCSA